MYQQVQDQEYANVFWKIVEAHNLSNGPLMGGKGPSIAGFKINEMKFSFVTKNADGLVDLVIFNWDKELFPGLVQDKKFSDLYGKPVHVVRNLDSASIASQGESGDTLGNFSYLLGGQSPLADFKPNPYYLDKNNPLRQALKNQSLVILSPDRNWLCDQMTNVPVEAITQFWDDLKARGGFEKIFNETTIHEMFHVKASDDRSQGLSEERLIEPNRELLVAQLDNTKLKELLSAYTGLIFQIGNKLSKGKDAKNELGNLGTLIEELKVNHKEAWKFIWNYEYSEGFAEYASAQSFIDAKVVHLDEKIEQEIADKNNNFAYRTGTLGGLYLRNKIKKMPFNNNEDHFQSVWEIILSEEKIKPSGSLEKIVTKNKISEKEFNPEINLVKEYLTGTLVE